MINSEVLELFPTPLYVGKLTEGVTKDEFDFVNQDSLYTYFDENPGGNTGSFNNNVLNLPELSRIKNFIQEHLDHYAKNVMCIENRIHPTISWLNKNQKGTAHYRHYHVNSILSGVFYFTEDPAPITFHNEKNFSYLPLKWNPVRYNQFNSTKSDAQVKKDILLIFPSFVEHSVMPNISNDPRISLSFNTWISGDIGDVGSSSYINFDDLELHNTPEEKLTEKVGRKIK
jgi:uncharacterized protein (TIGR02466 family)